MKQKPKKIWKDASQPDPNPHILIESGGLADNTRLYVVNGDKKMAIPRATAVKWEVDLKNNVARIEFVGVIAHVKAKAPLDKKTKKVVMGYLNDLKKMVK
jgi:hypothetical protein